MTVASLCRFVKNRKKLPSLLAAVRCVGEQMKRNKNILKTAEEALHSIAEFVQSNSQSGYIEGYQQKRKTSWRG